MGEGRVGAASRALFGKGGALNSGQLLRIGLGRQGGQRVFRIGGNLVLKLTGQAHIDLVRLGPL